MLVSASSSGGGGVAGSSGGGVIGSSGGRSARLDGLFGPSGIGGPAQDQFPYFPLYVLDNNDGVVLFPGVAQAAHPGAAVELNAQVSGTAVSSYSWNTTGLGSATNISGANTSELTFQWSIDVPTTMSQSVTLSVTDTNSHVETYTYDFELFSGSSSNSSGGGSSGGGSSGGSSSGGGSSGGGSSGGGTSGGGTSNVSWPSTIAPDLIGSSSPAWSSDGVAVAAVSGALQTSIALPSYNPNVPALALDYDSRAANPHPIILAESPIPASGAPNQVSATLTFDGTAGTAWYYNTSALNPGDVQQIALQADASALATGRYSYSAQVVDEVATPTTTTYNGSATVVNESSDALGAGWSVDGLERVVSTSAGAIVLTGAGSASLWFASGGGSGGSSYVTPAGDFSTLAAVPSGGGWTRTLPDGTVLAFNSNGQETASTDRNGQITSYTYNSGGNLTSIEDPYGNTTTFTYSGGALSAIEDPAGRVTAFAMSGGDLTGVTRADGSHTAFAYGPSGRMTATTDPLGHKTTITYDSAGRVGTIARPDATTQEFHAFQEEGWTNSGTSSSPAPAVLLAAAVSSYTDPNGNTTTMRPDWFGLGAPTVGVDALGDVSTSDVGANGLPCATIDPLNNIARISYDGHGNPTTIVNPDASQEILTYNNFAEPLTDQQADSNTYTYTYDTHGNLTQIQDPLGNLTTMTYTGTGMLQSVTDADNHTTTYQYDSQDRATTVLNADGTSVKFGYDNQGDATSITDPMGRTSTFAYDALDRKIGATDPLGNHTTYIYDSGGNLTADEEPTPSGQAARTTDYAYDSMDRVTTVTDPLGRETVYAHDADGNVTGVTDPMGRIWNFEYDILNREVSVTDPLGGTTTTTYDADGDRLTVTDPLGRTTTMTYNDRGWLASETDPLGFTAYESYDAMGRVTLLGQPTVSGGGTSGGSLEQTFKTYDADGRLSKIIDPTGATTTYQYDGAGNETSVTDPNGNTTTFAYDSMNRVTTVTDALGDTTVYGHDADGEQTSITDGLGHTTTTLYDADGRATTLVNALGDTTTITYDSAGRETGLTDSDGNTTSWAYDADDELVKTTDPNGATVTYLYDADGEVTDTTDQDGRRTTYSYDSGGRDTGETWVARLGGALNAITYTYDADGELTGAADDFATLSFDYDADGHQTAGSTSGPGTGQPSMTLTRSVDPSGNVLRLSDSLGTSDYGITTYVYDADERVSDIVASYDGTTATIGPQVSFQYDAGGRLTSTSRTDSGGSIQVNTSYSYDAANRQTTIADQASDGYDPPTALATFAYDYDAADRSTSETDAEGTASFTYDASDQLTGVTGSRSESYSYDSNGNRTGTGYTTGVGNAQTSAPGYNYTYDNAGNLVSQTDTSTHVTTTFSYDYRNRLTGVSVGGTAVATYTYDALNRRIGIDDNGAQTWTVYDGKNPYADFDGSGNLKERYLTGPGVVNGAVVDELLARTDASGGTAWYLTDKLGSVRDIVDPSGTVLDHVVYDSFGGIISQTHAANGDRFMFAGMEWDGVTGKYYVRARYYDPTTGRFLAQDPIGFVGGDINLYRYVAGHPTDATDPNGTDMISNAVSGVQQFVSDYSYYFNQNVQSVYNYIYTGELNPSSEAYAAAMEAAGGSYAQNSGWAHQVLSAIGAVPCAGKLAIYTNSALYDLENEGYVTSGTILGVLSYVWNVGECFAAGTPLLTPEGDRPIDELRPGDWVLTRPENDPDAAPVARFVEAVFHAQAELITLMAGGRSIQTTAGHPFWVQRRGWTKAKDLIEGDLLRSHDGRWIYVAGLQDTGVTSDVYNLRVAEHHTYFVGARDWGFSVWAHNTCWYHGTDEESGNNIVNSGLNEDEWKQFGPDTKGFSVTSDPEQAQQWAEWRTNPEIGERDGRGGPIVIYTNQDIPVTEPGPGTWGDPGEYYIAPEDFPQVGPGVFQPYNPPPTNPPGGW